MKKFLKIASRNTLFLFCVISFMGCSVFMAAKQPPKKNLNVLEKGTARADVLAELGAPINSEQKDGKKVDIFSFRQGYTKGVKVCRAVFHGVADVFTLGLWEIIGTPTEMIADGKDIKVEVIYNKDDKVEQSNILEPKPKTTGSPVTGAK